MASLAAYPALCKRYASPLRALCWPCFLLAPAFFQYPPVLLLPRTLRFN